MKKKSFNGKMIRHMNLTEDNNQFQLYYENDEGKLDLVRFSAYSITDYLKTSLSKFNFVIDAPTWGYYRLTEDQIFNSIGRKLIND